MEAVSVPGVAIIEERAPAKINLALHVTGRRADGYHELDSFVAFCDVGDRLTFQASEKDRFSIGGPFAAGLDGAADNLVVKACEWLRERLAVADIAAPPVAILLEKNLPIASGIGGGSADAAAALRGLARLWRVEGRLDDLALRLGADVPMCLLSQPLRAQGIGERLTPVRPFPEVPSVLVNPGVPLATPAVFARLDRRDNPPMPESPPLASLAALLSYLDGTRNDLQTPATALAPVIEIVLDALNRAGAQFARMSGSGATCFGLFDSPTAAEAAAKALQAGAPGWYVQPTLLCPKETCP